MKRIIEYLSTEDNTIDLEKLLEVIICPYMNPDVIGKMIKGTNS